MLKYLCLSYIYIFLSIPFNESKIIQSFTNTETCEQEWTQLLQTLTRGDPDELRIVISPFVNASLSTYVDKKSNSDNVPVSGWTVIHERVLGSTGMDALAFQKNSNPRLVMIAIRGIHIKNVTAESMDICAIWWLTRNDPSLKICTLLFSEYQMNYFQQLLDFVSEVDDKLPDSTCKIFTGHSMGALLCSLASAHSRGVEPCIGFGPSGALKAAQRIGLPTDYWFNVYSFYISCDANTLNPMSWTNQTGTLCELYDTTNCEPCDKCLELQRLKSNFETFLDPSCQKCITSVHYISNYADVLNRNTPYTCKKVLTTDVSESAGGQDNFSDNL